MSQHRPAYRDPWLWGALVVALLLRITPLLIWGEAGCIRDECAYASMAVDISQGKGLQPTERWLWAPLYPYLLGLWTHFGTVMSFKRVQVLLSVGTVAVVYGIGLRIGTRRVARAAAMMLALNPTVAFFAARLWTETVFVLLLSVAIALMLWVRDGPAHRGIALGVVLGACALTRGFGVWMAPLFVVAVLWPQARWRDALRTRWPHALATVVAAVMTIAPYSVVASKQHGGLVISDATMGEVAYMGNNDFPLVTWDIGVGLVSSSTQARVVATGRERCDLDLPVAAFNACEVDRAKAWIAANPGTFVARIPQRWAHLLNPNSFLTRHVRLGLWPGTSWWFRDLTTLWVILTSIGLIMLGTVGVVSRGKGAIGVLSALLALYLFATIGVLFGVSRFRLPLVTLWTLWAAMALVEPRQTWRALIASRPRLALLTVLLLALLPLVTWHLSAGFPSIHR